jgi:NAD+ synthase
MADPFLAWIPEDQPIRRGNVLARLRMIVLYDRSADFQGLVIGTGNKTEIYLGYTTLYGDSACALNPIGDLYKTQVRQLARALGVPEVILAKPPSADLWPGQTDEGELGFTYARVDQVLKLLVDEACPPEACVDAGFDRTFVQAVLDRMRRNEFKRRPPLIGRLPASRAGRG